MRMRVRVRLQIEDENGTVVADDEVLGLAKPADRVEDLGLSLEEAKRMLRATQERLLAAQAADYTARHRCCPDCGCVRTSKGCGRSGSAPCSARWTCLAGVCIGAVVTGKAAEASAR